MAPWIVLPACRFVTGLLLIWGLALDALAWNAGIHGYIADQALVLLDTRRQRHYQGLAEDLAKLDASRDSRRSPMAYLAVLPDELRDKPLEQLFKDFGARLPKRLAAHKDRNTRDWHFHNNPVGNESQVRAFQGCDSRGGGRMVEMMDILDKTLSDGLDRRQKALVLAFQIHLVGDIHQPLHSLTRITKGCEHDMGGNRFCLDSRLPTRCQASLHALWDSAAGLRLGSLRPARSPGNHHFNPGRWSDENLGLATFIYSLDPDKPATSSYRAEVRRVSAQRIKRAIVRLAVYLEAKHR